MQENLLLGDNDRGILGAIYFLEGMTEGEVLVWCVHAWELMSSKALENKCNATSLLSS
jgi:hypothetical protein